MLKQLYEIWPRTLESGTTTCHNRKLITWTRSVSSQVLHHGQPTLGDSHRFSVTSDPEDTFSQERLASVYRELGDNKLSPVPFFRLLDHPIIQDCLSMCHRYKTPDLRSVFTITVTTIAVDDANSIMS